MDQTQEHLYSNGETQQSNEGDRNQNSTTHTITSNAVRDLNLRSASQYAELDSSVMLGRTFGSLVEAQNFFTTYSQCLGFGLRKDEKRRDNAGMVKIRRWVCYKQGLRRKKDVDETEAVQKPKREPRSETRVNCKACFRVNFDVVSRLWEIRQWNDTHNHQLCIAEHVHYLLANRIVSEGVLSMAQSMKRVGVKTSQIMEYIVEQNDGFLNAGFIKRDLQNRIDAERRLKMADGDAVSALAYLYAHAERDPGFFLKYSVDEDRSLHNILWCDSTMKTDYMIFGDVIGFDSTYKINSYHKPLVVFIGINHHNRTNVFGFGLLANETEESYIWILQTFLEAMGGKRPNAVITDSDPAIMVATRTVLPEATHRLCSWHISKNANQNLDKTGLQAKAFNKCMRQVQTVPEFEREWENFVNSHGLGNNSWITRMYEKKNMWAEAYLRGKFFGMMRSNQRCESMNAYLKHFVEWKLKMFEFVRQIDRAVRRIRHLEAFEDFTDLNGTPPLSTHLADIEKQAAEVLTRRAFFLFRKKIRQETSLTIECAPIVMSDRYVYRISSYKYPDRQWTLEYRISDGHITCSCLGFETDGIPCKHTFAVMKQQKLKEIPPSLIHDRWKKNAKSRLVNAQVHRNVDSSGHTARHGALTAASARMIYLGSKSLTGFPILMEKIAQLTSMMEDIVQREEGFTVEKGEPQRIGTFVMDPKVVRTKGCGTTQHRESTRSGGKNRCKYCEQLGHNSRGCPKKREDERNMAASQFQQQFTNTQTSQNNYNEGLGGEMEFNYNESQGTGMNMNDLFGEEVLDQSVGGTIYRNYL